MTARYTFLNLDTVNRPYMSRIREAICRVAESGRYIGGPEVDEFERQLSALCGVPYAIGTSNGLDALRLIFRAYIENGVMQAGDEVLVPADTYIASVLAITDNGLVPVFADADPLTMNLDTADLERYASPRLRAVMTVHLYGRVCYDKALADFARRHNLKIVEDNAQAIGARAEITGPTGSTVTGALGDAAAFSFYPTKNIGALGDAGAVTTSDTRLAETIRALANYGATRTYHNVYRGLNCRMDPMQAAVLTVKLPHVDSENLHRRAIAAVYEREIGNPLITKPLYAEDFSSVWHQYVVRTADRERFRRYLADNGVETMVHYPVAVPDQPCYSADYKAYVPVSRGIAAECVSLPVSTCTSVPDAAEIARIINNYKG